VRVGWVVDVQGGGRSSRACTQRSHYVVPPGALDNPQPGAVDRRSPDTRRTPPQPPPMRRQLQQTQVVMLREISEIFRVQHRQRQTLNQATRRDPRIVHRLRLPPTLTRSLKLTPTHRHRPVKRNHPHPIQPHRHRLKPRRTPIPKPSPLRQLPHRHKRHTTLGQSVEPATDQEDDYAGSTTPHRCQQQPNSRQTRTPRRIQISEKLVQLLIRSERPQIHQLIRGNDRSHPLTPRDLRRPNTDTRTGRPRSRFRTTRHHNHLHHAMVTRPTPPVTHHYPHPQTPPPGPTPPPTRPHLPWSRWPRTPLTTPPTPWLTPLNPPGVSGDSSPWEGWSHVRKNVEEVPGRAA
jgi:hypothetical protein